MADIQLTRPAANQTQIVTSTPDARFVLNFPTGEAKLAKSENGENLILTFDDGAKIEVEGFYTTFDKDSLPTLNVGGQDITGEQLVAILGEDLMPAAGPSAGQAATQGGRFRSFADADLNGGLDRLGGLDIGFDDATQQDDNPDNYYALTDEPAGTLEETGPEPAPMPTPAPTPTPTPVPSPTPEPFSPPDGYAFKIYDTNSTNAGDSGGMVYRAGLLAPSDEHPTTTAGDLPSSLVVRSSEGVRDISINGMTVVKNGVLVAGAELATPDGVLRISGFGEWTDGAPGSGEGYRLDYTYILANSSGGDAGHNFAVVVTDNLGQRLNSAIVVNVKSVDADKNGSNDNGHNINGSYEGGDGNDTLNAVQDSLNTLHGGDGNDLLRSSNSDWYTLSNPNPSGSNSAISWKTGPHGTDNYTFHGGNGNDTIVGGLGNDTIYGGNGSDLIVSTVGNNLVHGGDGDDTVIGTSRNVTGGNDTIHGGDGNDVMYGGDDHDDGDDLMYGGKGDDYLCGGAGNDTLYGGDGNDTLDGTDGNDTMHGGNGSDLFYGGIGNDVMYGGRGNDTMWGNADNDTLYGGDGNDSMGGGAGDDALYGGDGNDSMGGHDGNDLLDGGTGHDSLYGNAGNDTLIGGAGNDLLSGGVDNDMLIGGDGDDSLKGGDGDDYLHGGSGADEISGGAGNDLIVYDIVDSKLDGGEGIDFVLASDSDLTMDKLLNGWQGGPLDGPHAENVEVLIKGGDALKLTSVEQMANEYGIMVDGDKLKLDTSKWAEQADGSFTFKSGADLTLEVNGNSMVADASSDLSQAVFALTTGHGG